MKKELLKETEKKIIEFMKGDVRLDIKFEDGSIKKVIIFDAEGTNDDFDIELELRKMGVPPHIKGFCYIIESLNIILEDRKILNRGITKMLYPAVARKFETVPIRVEHAIRYAIKVTWAKGDKKILNDIFRISPEKGTPTNVEFLALLSDYLKIKFKI